MASQRACKDQFAHPLRQWHHGAQRHGRRTTHRYVDWEGTLQFDRGSMMHSDTAMNLIVQTTFVGGVFIAVKLYAIHAEIDIAERLCTCQADEVGKRRYCKEIAQYYCELAANAYSEKKLEDVEIAERALDAALNADAKCVRVHLMRGEWRAAEGKHEEAIAIWQKIESQDPAYLGLMAEKLLASYDALGRGAEGLLYLRELQRQYAALDLLNAIFTATLAGEGAEAAYQLVKQDLRTNPTLVGLDRLLEAQIIAAPDERKEDLIMLKALVHSHSSRLAVYLCKQCGFKAKQFYWHCPACGGWETFPPRRTAEYDSADRHLARLHVEG